MLMVRLAKILLVAAVAAFALIVAYDNIVDYNPNYQFVRLADQAQIGRRRI